MKFLLPPCHPILPLSQMDSTRKRGTLRSSGRRRSALLRQKSSGTTVLENARQKCLEIFLEVASFKIFCINFDPSMNTQIVLLHCAFVIHEIISQEDLVHPFLGYVNSFEVSGIVQSFYFVQMLWEQFTNDTQHVTKHMRRLILYLCYNLQHLSFSLAKRVYQYQFFI